MFALLTDSAADIQPISQEQIVRTLDVYHAS